MYTSSILLSMAVWSPQGHWRYDSDAIRTFAASWRRRFNHEACIEAYVFMMGLDSGSTMQSGAGGVHASLERTFQ